MARDNAGLAVVKRETANVKCEKVAHIQGSRFFPAIVNGWR
jgi:hypothetical protein